MTGPGDFHDLRDAALRLVVKLKDDGLSPVETEDLIRSIFLRTIIPYAIVMAGYCSEEGHKP